MKCLDIEYFIEDWPVTRDILLIVFFHRHWNLGLLINIKMNKKIPYLTSVKAKMFASIPIHKLLQF